jgi:hypothetical protein
MGELLQYHPSLGPALTCIRATVSRQGVGRAVYTWSFETKRSPGPGLSSLGRGTSGLSSGGEMPPMLSASKLNPYATDSRWKRLSPISSFTNWSGRGSVRTPRPRASMVERNHSPASPTTRLNNCMPLPPPQRKTGLPSPRETALPTGHRAWRPPWPAQQGVGSRSRAPGFRSAASSSRRATVASAVNVVPDQEGGEPSVLGFPRGVQQRRSRSDTLSEHAETKGV